MANFDEAFLNGGFDLPEVSGLTDKAGAVFEMGKEMKVVMLEIVEQVAIFMKLEEFAADFYGDDFLVSESGLKTSASKFEGSAKGIEVLDNQTVNVDDKRISIHRVNLL
jgi:hypothetical protein